MKYYFTGSTRRIQADGARYKMINEFMETLGYKALNYVHFPANNSVRKHNYERIQKGEISVYDLQMSLIDQADILIADVTTESVTVGYQVSYAIRKKIPVLVLVNSDNERSISVVLTDDHLGLLTIEKYTTEVDIKQILKKFVKNAISERIKFNFFLNIPIHNYITKRASNEGKNKSQVIRDIIQEEMQKNPL